MSDRFNELLSNLEQQINKALAEARATQSEPLERERNVESRFDMIAPGEQQQQPLSFAPARLEGASTGEDIDTAAEQSDYSVPEIPGISFARAAAGGTAENQAGASFRGSSTLDDSFADQGFAPGAQGSSSPQTDAAAGAGDGGPQQTFAFAEPSAYAASGTQNGSVAGPADPVTGEEPEEQPAPGAQEPPPAEQQLHAPELTTSDIVSDEDAQIDFSSLLNANAGGQNGTLSVTISGVPAGASFSAGTETAPGVWTFTQAQLHGLTFNPPANSDVDFSLQVTATLTDANGNVAANTAQIDVELDAVADAPVVSHEAGQQSEIVLRVSGDHYQGSPMMRVDIDGQTFTFRITADHRTGEWQEIRLVGDFGPDGPQNIGVSYINDHYQGTSATDRNLYVDKIDVNGKTYEAEGQGVSYDRGSDTIDGRENMAWNGRLNFDTSDNGGPSNATAVGAEDQTVDLNLKAALGDSDGSETLSLKIFGVPAEVQLSAGTKNADGSWSVTPGELEGLKVVPPTNYNGDFTLRVEATSTEAANGHSTTTSFELPVRIAPVNDAPTNLTLANSIVAENAAGAIIGKLDASDIDVGDNVTYSVSDSRFEVVDGNLKLKAGVSLNYESTPTINLKITATDTAGAKTELNTQVQVTNVNEGPSTPSLTYSTINENAVGGVVGKVTATDPDAGDTINYTLSDNRFEIVDGNLKLKAGISLNYEVEPKVALKITATDNGGLTSVKDVTINVKNVNEGPSTPNVTVSAVAENAAGAIVGQVSATDPDAGDSIRYTVSDSRFEVVNGNIKLKDGVSLNYETTPSVTLKVTAIDNGNLKSEKTVTLEVSNVNEAPTTPTLNATKVTENAAGATIGKVTSTDPDAGDSVTYGVDDSRFEIVNGNLKLKAGVSLDHETEPTVNVKIIATDSHGLATEKTFTITVNNVNEAPTGVNLSNSAVAENAAGAVVGQLSTVDQDAGDAHKYTVSDNRFEVVDGNLKLKAGVSLNHETEPSINVKVTATDNGGLKVEKTFTVNVDNVNEGPSTPTLNGNTVAENAAGVVIGHVSATDPDAGDTLQYSVSDSRFEVVNGDLKLKAGVSLNHETEPTVNVKVTATDSGGLSSEKTFTVDVQNVNEGPSQPTLSATTVAENAAGATVGQVSATDPDAGDTLQYSVSDSRFEVVNGDLKLKAGVSLNHEVEPSVDVKVTVTDSGGLSSEKTFNIGVTDVNEAPQATAIQGQFALRGEGFSVDVSDHFSDVDAGDSLTYSISGPSWMQIDPTTGEITGTPPSALTELQMVNGTYQIGGNHSLVLDMTNFSASAGHDNTIGIYYTDESGKPLGGVVVYESAKELSGFHSETILSQYPTAKAMGFFIIENGNNLAHNYNEGEFLSFVKVGNGYQASWGPNGETASTFFSNSALNADGISHLTDNSAHGDFNWEDLTGGGDNDYDDVNFNATVKVYSDAPSVTKTVTVTATDENGLTVTKTFPVTISDERADNIQGTAYADVISGGASADTLRGNAGNDIVNGGDGNDTIYGNAGADKLYGGAGDDKLYIDAADTAVQGGDGYDKVFVEGTTGVTLNMGSAGVEYVEGGSGADVFNASTSTAATTQYGNGGNDTLTGGTGNDLFYGGTGDDTVSGGAGSDTAYLGDGNDVFDTINGNRDDGDGPDTVYGEGGNDTIWGGGDVDLLYGGDGTDTINGEAGNDTIYGDAGADTLTGDIGSDTIYGGNDNDTLYGGADADTLYGDMGDDKLYGGDGNDTLQGMNGNDMLRGEAGNDSLTGGSGADTLYGDAGNDWIYGGSENDQLYGGDGDDTLDGNSFEDTLYGGAGNDTLDGGEQNDTLYGGDGGDMFMYAKGTGFDTIYGGEGQGWLDTIHVSGVASGLDANGLGSDWTLQIDHGSIVSADDNGLTLSQDADGSIVFNDGTSVAFHDIGRIEWN